MPEDAPTLQRAIGRASPGDTIVLAPASYPGGVLSSAREARPHHPRGRPSQCRTRRRRPARERHRGPRRRRVRAQPLGARLHEERALLGRAGPVPRLVRHGLERRRVRDLRRGRRATAAWITRTCRAQLGRRTTSASAGPAGRRSPTSSHGCPQSATRERTRPASRSATRAGSQRCGNRPNTYANEALPPQERATIVRNTVSNSGRARVPIKTALAGFVGIGIAIAGGNENAIVAIG